MSCPTPGPRTHARPGPSAQDPDHVWAGDYAAPFVFDEAGVYEVHMLWTLKHPVVDVGWSLDPTGRWDHYAGLVDDLTTMVHVSD